MALSGHTEGLSVFNFIAGELSQVERLIEEELCRGGEAVTEIVRDFNRSGSKQIRPAMVLLSGAACGKITSQHIHTAAIIELIHNATLLHDDVIDEGTKRRGAPTINKLHGNEAAVLLGDFLLSRVFAMCGNLDSEIFKAIALATTRTCEGELMQLRQRQNWELSESEYLKIIGDKTAALFGACCFAGGILAQVDSVFAKSLYEFGINTGIAFQIADDLLDIAGDESQMGKSTGNDMDRNKLTLPVIHFLNNSRESERENLIGMLSLSAQKISRAELVNILNSYRSIEYTKNRAKDFADKAITYLAGIPDNDAKKALIETAKISAHRFA